MPAERNATNPTAVHTQWYNDVSPIPATVMVETEPGSTCPSCHMPFDKGKKRKLIDACGHERCYSSKLSKKSLGAHVRQCSDSGLPIGAQARPKVKTNGHFTPFMQARQEHAVKRESSPLGIELCREDALTTSYPPRETIASPKIRHIPWPHRKHRLSTSGGNQPTAFSVFQSWPAEMFRKIRSLWSLDDETSLDPPPPAESARHDLFMRLGLLLGDRDRSQSPLQRLSGRRHPNGKIQQSCTSLSSLTSSDANTSASNSTSPLSTLTASSEADHLVGQANGFRSSRDPSSESMASLMSSSTGTTGTSMTSGSGSPMSTLPRRHSITTTAPGPVEDLALFGKKRPSSSRNSRANATKLPLEPTVVLNDYSTSHIELKPLFFEVPQPGKSSLFIGRQWLFREMEEILNSNRQNSRGVVITGGIGSGKTSIILQLVEHSCFGRKRDEPLYCEIYEGKQHLSLSGSRASLSNSRWSLNQPCHRIRHLSSRVVAYHFCQADNNLTCLVPEFVHSVAAQLCQAPQLAAYRELLLREPCYQEALSRKECITDPSTALLKGILEPLCSLRQVGKIGNDLCLLVVDSLNEAEFHRPDYGDTIASFLSRHIFQFPSWLRVVVTVRTALKDITKWLPFYHISLDDMSNNENLPSDLFDYITQRINDSPDLRANVTFNGKLESCSTARFTNHLLQLSKGCFLYTKLTLDHIERGHLVMKSVSYKVLPINLAEVFLLHFNLRFPTTQSFQKVAVLLNTCLASLYPMSLLELYHTINAGQVGLYISWDDYLQRMEALSEFLVERQDNTYMFFHPSFREWLIHRNEGEATKFLCEPRTGHANIAFRLTRLEAPLGPDKTNELGHHILKAHIYKTVSRQRGFLSRDVQALWVTLSSKNVSAALVSQRNIYSPNAKVSRLLMLAGANANELTEFFNSAPVLGLFAYEGFMDLVLMLLEFGADVNGVAKNGTSVFCLACAGGHLDIVKLLLSRGAHLHHVDSSGHSAVIYGALHGHLQVVTLLLQCDWSSSLIHGLCRTKAAQQALVMAASRGHTLVCEYLLSVPGVDINASDTVSRETSLTAAASKGQKDTCMFLLRRGASVVTTNGFLTPPLQCAVREGYTEIASLLMQYQADVDQTDGYGKTALMLSVCGGHVSLAEILISRGCSITKADNEGLTALCWACLKGQFSAVQLLLDHGANLHHTDCTGRTPLNLAAFHGDPSVVQLLLDRGATVEHVDHNGMRPLDRAIGCKNTAAVICFLKRGAKLGPATWTMAADKPDIMLILLSKLLEDGSMLYKKNRLKDAAYRFQYALKKFPTDTVSEEARPFQQLKVNLLLNLSRCRRKSSELDAAVDLATKALEVNPRSYEAFYARARARRDLKQQKLAAEDLAEAIKLAPENRELRRLLQHIRDDIKENGDACIIDNGRPPNLYGSITNGTLSDIEMDGVSTPKPSILLEFEDNATNHSASDVEAIHI